MYNRSKMYKPLKKYNITNNGEFGATEINGEQIKIPTPSFAGSMSQQKVPQYNVSYMGTPSTLQHGLPSEQLTGKYFSVKNAYSTNCTTFNDRSCDGVSEKYSMENIEDEEENMCDENDESGTCQHFVAN